MDTKQIPRIRSLAVSAVIVAVALLASVPEPSAQNAPTAPTSYAADKDLIARGVAQLPGWISKADRELISMHDGKVPGPDFTKRFNKTSARIRMRDGAELYTEFYIPLNQGEPLPIIFERSPYGLAPDVHGYSVWLRRYMHLMKDGYIFAFQDTRGRGNSTGKYISLAPMRAESAPNSADESTDAYDSIDWIVKNVPRNNGKVGMLGISYDAWLTTRALVNPHPALKAASPQATCADMFIGDDFHHNGAFRLEYAFDWIAWMEQAVARFSVVGRYDHYDRFLEWGPLSNVNKDIFHGKAPSWNAFVQHPNLDSFYRTELCGDVLSHIRAPVAVPTLSVGGWFDAEDFFGTLAAYKKYELGDTHGINNLVIGPWAHGGWDRSDGRTLGAVDFGSDTGRWYQQNIEAPWLAHWLKGGKDINLPEVLSFRTGANQWQRYPSWPPKGGIKETKLYLRANGALSFEPPNDTSAARDQYVSDPDKPVPYVPRPITDNGWSEWELVDQRFVSSRSDVLTYETSPLDQDITITGESVAHLFAATTGTDADWIVKLIDVYPDVVVPENMGGFEFMLAEEVFRARYRNSFEKPEPLKAGQIVPYEFSLRSRDHTFKSGHRIMVQIQSTWFPMIDRNPQKYVPSIYDAVQGDFQKATQNIYRSKIFPSYVSLPINTH